MDHTLFMRSILVVDKKLGNGTFVRRSAKINVPTNCNCGPMRGASAT